MIDIRHIENAIAGAFEATAIALFDECQNQLEEVRSDWPNDTQTRSRGIKGSPREISDTGELERSGDLDLRTGSALLTWDAPNATSVYFGIYNETIRPARPWTLWALEELDLAEIMARELEKRL